MIVDETRRRALMKILEDFLKPRPEIRFAYLFGSFADGGHFRDIDVGIYIDETDPVTRDKFYDIRLSTDLEEMINIPVDFVVLNRAPDALVYHASKGIILKNSDDDLRVDFITLRWKFYMDFKPVLEQILRERKELIKNSSQMNIAPKA